MDLCEKAFRHQQIAPRMIVVRGPHVLGAVGVVGIDEDDIGELALARVLQNCSMGYEMSSYLRLAKRPVTGDS